MGGGGQRLGPESEARALSYAFTRLVGPHHFLFPLVRAHCVLKPFLLLSKQAPRGCFRVCLEDLSELWAQSFGRFVKKRLGPAHGYIYFPLSNRLESLSPLLLLCPLSFPSPSCHPSPFPSHVSTLTLSHAHTDTLMQSLAPASLTSHLLPQERLNFPGAVSTPGWRCLDLPLGAELQ